MKKFFIVFAIIACVPAAFSQTLITYGNNTISKDEFLRAYNKNKPATTDKEKSMRDYLELYTDFKLKVKAAEQLKLDTISQIRYDIQNFRDQITESYMSNEQGMQMLIDEAAARSQKDLHVLRFFVPVPTDAAPADTLKAYNAAAALYNILRKGNTDYTKIAGEISNKIYPAKYSDIGYITAFSVNYDLENIIYNTKPGEVSAPHRTAKGWNLFKVIGERPSTGKWKVAQLLFAYPPNADETAKLIVKKKADSVYRLLQKGLLFSDAAKLYSDDRLTYLTGGELPEFSSGKYDAGFENNVFDLKKDNDLTAPFETAFGYHIVKRLSRILLPADPKDPGFQFDMKQKVMQDMRINREKEKFALEISAKTGLRRTGEITDADMYRYIDTIMRNTPEKNISQLPISKKTIIAFKDGTQVKGEEWLSFVKEYYSNPEQKKLSGKALAEKFMAVAATDYYKKHLENYSSDFKYQMQEFREGNMLFEIMERNVWSKAGADSSGLLDYYNAHKEKYKWAASADMLVFNCADEKAGAEVKNELSAGKGWLAIAEKSNARVQADSGRYELDQVPGSVLITNPAAGSVSNIIKNADGTFVVLKFIKVYAAGMQRSFAEARGLVINDYQNVLERRWIQALRAQNPVKTDEALFRKMLN